MHCQVNQPLARVCFKSQDLFEALSKAYFCFAIGSSKISKEKSFLPALQVSPVSLASLAPLLSANLGLLNAIWTPSGAAYRRLFLQQWNILQIRKMFVHFAAFKQFLVATSRSGSAATYQTCSGIQYFKQDCYRQRLRCLGLMYYLSCSNSLDKQSLKYSVQISQSFVVTLFVMAGLKLSLNLTLSFL